MELRAARRSERDEVLELLGLWYNDRAFFARYNQNDPKFRDDLCLIARDGRALVAPFRSSTARCCSMVR